MSNIYDQDGLTTKHNHDFMQDPDFIRSYNRGAHAAMNDYKWHWRVHVGLWSASLASKLEGDFVEAGVNKGFLSSAIMESLDWDSQNRMFYLLDTFAGINLTYVTEEEKKLGIVERNQQDLDRGFYAIDASSVINNFSQWKNVNIIVGSIPETLNQITAKKIAFLHVDLNCAMPEVATVRNLWDRIVAGGVILLDDYAFIGYETQKHAMDRLAKELNVSILSLPTGQGLIIKPPISKNYCRSYVK